MEHQLETKFITPINSMRSEGEHALVFHTVNFVFENVMCKVKHFSRFVHAWHRGFVTHSKCYCVYMEIVNNS